MASRWTPGSLATVGLVTALALLLAAAMGALWQVESFDRAQVRVQHGLEVLRALDGLTRAIADAEAAQRAYLLTTHDDDLAPLTSATTALPDALARLRALTRDSLAQQRRLEALRPLIAAKLDELSHAVVLRQTGGLVASLDLVDTANGKRLTDDIRRRIDEMAAEERAAITGSLATADDHRQRVVLLLVLASAGGALLLLAGLGLRARGTRDLTQGAAA